MTTLSRTDVLGKNLFFLLDLSYAGRTYHLSSRVLNIVRDDGTVIPYQAGLNAIDYSDTHDLFGISTSQISIPISIILPDTNVAELVSSGYDPTTATGEISFWIEGTVYETRNVIMSGSAIDPIFGGADEALTFSLEQNPYEDTSLTIDPKANINDTTTPNLDSGSEGEKINQSDIYPTIFGKPELSLGSSTPALLINVVSGDTPDTIHLLVAGHSIETGTVTVELRDDDRFLDSSVPGASVTTTPSTDGEGRAITTCILTAALGEDMADRDGRKWYTNWDGTASGISNTSGSSMRGAGDIIEYMLKRSTLDVDFGNLGGQKQLLNEFKLDFYINDPSTYWEYIKSNILPILPVTVSVGPKGLKLTAWNFEPSDDDFVASIDVQTTKAERIGRVRYENPKKLANDITLDYAMALPKRVYTKYSNVHGDELKLAGTVNGSYLNKVCRLSYNRFGPKKEIINTNIVYDSATASAITTWMSYAYGLRTRSITYEFDSSWAWLKAGNLIKLTDSELFLSDTKCFVEVIDVSDESTFSVTFKIFDSMN